MRLWSCFICRGSALYHHTLPCGKRASTLRSEGSTASPRPSRAGSLLDINAKGYVPVIRLDDGRVLTEGSAIVQYIADQKPESGLAPRAGTWERYKLQEWLNFITSEVHKAYKPLFNKAASQEAKEGATAILKSRFEWLAGQLAESKYLMGEEFTVADAYLFTVLGWTAYVGINLGQWPAVKTYHARIAERPKVQEALKISSCNAPANRRPRAGIRTSHSGLHRGISSGGSRIWNRTACPPTARWSSIRRGRHRYISTIPSATTSSSSAWDSRSPSLSARPLWPTSLGGEEPRRERFSAAGRAPGRPFVGVCQSRLSPAGEHAGGTYR
jgi:glutathione S-transferase